MIIRDGASRWGRPFRGTGWPGAMRAGVAVVLVAALGGASTAPERPVIPPAVEAAPVVTPRAVHTPPRTQPSPPQPSPTEGPYRLERSVPVRLQIEAIGVDTELMALGLNDDATMEVPPEGFPAGWYTGAPTPGELGPAILAGHVNWLATEGVFFRLAELAPGDEVVVAREDGSSVVFAVTSVEQHPKDAFPTADVYGDIDHAGLRLITCGGVIDSATRSHTDNIVVFASIVEPG